MSSSPAIPTRMIHCVMVACLTLTQEVQVQILMDHLLIMPCWRNGKRDRLRPGNLGVRIPHRVQLRIGPRSFGNKAASFKLRRPACGRFSRARFELGSGFEAFRLRIMPMVELEYTTSLRLVFYVLCQRHPFGGVPVGIRSY